MSFHMPRGSRVQLVRVSSQVRHADLRRKLLAGASAALLALPAPAYAVDFPYTGGAGQASTTGTINTVNLSNATITNTASQWTDNGANNELTLTMAGGLVNGSGTISRLLGNNLTVNNTTASTNRAGIAVTLGQGHNGSSQTAVGFLLTGTNAISYSAVESTVGRGAALYATQTNTTGSNSTNSAIDTSGGTTAFTGNHGIYLNQLGGSAGIITSATDTLTAITGSTGSGLRMDVTNYGNAFIINRASTTNQFGGYGLNYSNSTTGFLALHNSGALNGALGAINAVNSGGGPIRLGYDAALSTLSGLTGAMTGGISAQLTAASTIEIVTAAGGTISTATTSSAAGISATAAGNSTLNITTGAAITAPGAAVDGIITSAGAASINTIIANADITAGRRGIDVSHNTGSASVTVGTGATISGLTHGIRTTGSGVATLNINGRVDGNIVTGTGNDAITLTSSGVATDGVVTGTIDGGTGTNGLTLAGTSTTIAQDISQLSNISTITKSGTGTWAITGTSAINPTYAVSAGTLQIGSAGTSGTLGSGAVSIATAGTLAINRTDTITIANVIQNSAGGQNGNLTQAGTGTTILTGANTYSGTTTISAGTLQVGAGGTTGTLGTGGVTNNAALIFNRSDAIAYNDAISGTGSVTHSGAATLTLGGVNSYGGGTTVTAGTLRTNADSGLGATGSALTLNGGTFQFGANFTTAAARSIVLGAGHGTFDTSVSTGTVGGVISGSGNLIKAGTDTLILSGVNTYTGATTITGGTLSLSGPGRIAASSSVTNEGTFSISDAVGGVSIRALNGTTAPASVVLGNQTLTITNAAGTYAGGISGGGSLVIASGTQILAGATAAAGGTTIASGSTLQIGNGGASGTLSGNVANNGSLNFNRSGAANLVQTVSGSGALGVSGGVILATTLSQTYTGATSIAAGSSFVLTDSGSLAASSGIVNAGTFSIAGITPTGTAVRSLTGAGAVALGTKNLTITNAGGNFTGNMTGTGLLTIGGGTFSANGTIAGPVTVSNGAMLKGVGTIGGFSGSSGGTIAPGNSIGTLNVAGNVSFAAGSIYQVEVDATGASDRIAATGTATINGGTVDVQAAAGTYGTSTTYTILTATGGVTGTFTNATSNFIFLTPTLNYQANQVTLTLAQPAAVVPPVVVPPVVVPPAVVPPVVVPPAVVAPAPAPTFPGVAVTLNQAASATALQAGGAAGGDLFLHVLNSTSVANARSAFDGSSGEIHATLQAAQLESASGLRRTLLGRMRQDTGAAGWLVWGDVRGNFGHMDSDGNAARATSNGVAMTVGADTRIGNNWRAGFAGGYTASDVGVEARRSAARTHGGQFAAYAAGKYDAIAIRTGFAYGFGTATSRRDVGFALFNDALTAKQDVDSQQLFGEVGYGFKLTGVTIEPFAGLSWTRVNAGAFRENGGSAALAGNANARDDGFSTLGAQLFTTGSGIFTPSVRAGWQHAFTNRTSTRGLSFVSSGQGFAVRAPALDADRAVVDVDAALSLGGNTTVTLGYAGTLSARSQDHAVRLSAAIGL